MKKRDYIQKQYLICGLGNPVLTDDAIGILLVRKLMKKCDKKIKKLIDFKENQSNFLDMLDDFSGYRHLLIIDSIETLTEKPGTLILCEPENFQGISWTGYVGIHGLNFPTLLRLGRVLGNPLPETCTIAGITIKECKQFGTVLSKELKNKIPELLNTLVLFIQKWVNLGERDVINMYRKDIEKKFGLY